METNAKKTKELMDKRKQIFDKLVKSGASKLFAMYVLRYPNSHVATDFLQGLPGGGFYKRLWNGNFVKAMLIADLSNTDRLVELFTEKNWQRNYSRTPAYLAKPYRETFLSKLQKLEKMANMIENDGFAECEKEIIGRIKDKMGVE